MPFTKQNTPDLTDIDRTVMNAMAKKAYPYGHVWKRIELVIIRTVYQPGMSVDELLAVAC